MRFSDRKTVLFYVVEIALVIFLFGPWGSAAKAANMDTLTVDENGYALQENLAIAGDVTVNGGTLDINGHALTVGGNLLISGDGGRLKMTNAADVVEVAGNATFNGAASDGYLTAGVLKVGGDFSQVGNYNYPNSENYRQDYDKNAHSFSASGTHKVILNGTGAQTVSFERPSVSYSHFQNLEINNASTEGIILNTDIFVMGEAKWVDGKISETDGVLHIHTDSTIPRWSGNVKVISGWTLQASQSVIDGNLLVSGSLLDVNGKKLVVKGNMSISGDNGRLKMVNATDVVEVSGNVTFNGAASDGYLTAGVLKAGGDFSQVGDYYNEPNSGTDSDKNRDNNRHSFSASGTHNVILNGTGAQTVSFEKPESDYSHFQNFDINKPGEAVTVFSDDGEAVTENFSPEGSWGISETRHQGSGSWSDSPDGNYADNADSSLTSKVLDFTSAHDAHLSFWHKYNTENDKDFCKVEISVDGGGAWEELLSYTGQEDQWQPALVSLADYEGNAAVKIRFRLISNENGAADGWYVDDIRVLSGPVVHFTTNVFAKGNAVISSGALNEIPGILCLTTDSQISEWTGNIWTAGWTLQGDQVVNGSLTASGGTLDLNGHVLTVKDNLTVSGSLLDINSGSLKVNGNLTIAENYGRLKMVNEADVVEVSGNVTFSGAASDGYLTAGVLKVGGDFSQVGDYQNRPNSEDDRPYYDDNYYSFSASGTHKVILNGTGPQTVLFEKPSPDYSHFQNFEVNNTAGGVTLNTNMVVLGEAKWVAGELTEADGVLHVHTDSKVAYWPGNVKVGTGWTLGTAQSVIDGNLLVSGSLLDINGKKLVVKGDMIVSENYGRLKMMNEADVVEVTGNVTFNGAASDGYLTAGVLKVGGNFSQIGDSTDGPNSGDYSYYADNYHSFSASGTHKVILNGAGPQSVSFEKPSHEYSHFQNFEVNNTAGGVTLNANMVVLGEAKWVAGELTEADGVLHVHTDSKVAYWPGNVKVGTGWTLGTAQSVIDGNLLVSGSLLDVNGKKLVVKGDMIVSENYGRLKMVNEADVVEVSGNVTFSGAASDGYLTAGVLKVGGDFSQVGDYQNRPNSEDDRPYYDDNYYSFSASGTHKVILNGTGPQTVLFEKPSPDYSHFNDLELLNAAPEAVSSLRSNQIAINGSFYLIGHDPTLGGDIPAWSYLPGPVYAGSNLAPAAADFDLDGDQDLFLGQSGGTIRLYESLLFNPRQGKMGLGKNFTGGNYAWIPHNDALNLADAFTIEFYIKADSVSETKGIIGKSSDGYNPNGRNYTIWLDRDQYIQFSYHNAAGNQFDLNTPAGTIAIGQWHHVALTFDLSADAITLYIDGKKQAQRTAGGNPATNGKAVQIGRNSEGSDSNKFDGVLDEIRISDVVRYSGDFTPSSTPFAPDANTVGLWHLDETGTAEIRDAGNKGLDGWWRPWHYRYSKYAGIDVDSAAVPFFFDIDQDRDQDMFVGASDGKIRFYENQGSRFSPSWGPVQELKDDANEFIIPGQYSSPALADTDNDGLPELFIGYYGGIAQYRNIAQGTDVAPVWQRMTSNFLSLALGDNYVHPRFEDLERDNDLDLIIGMNDGTLMVVNNIGTPDAPVWAPPIHKYNGFDFGSRSVPGFADMDGDGVRDLIVGNSNGSCHIRRNSGTQRLTINNNQIATADPSATLTLDGTGMNAAAYYLSSSSAPPAPDAAGWTATDTSSDVFLENIPYTLEGGDGVKTAYLWFKALDESVYNTAWDTIVLDRSFATDPGLTGAAPTEFNQTFSDSLPNAHTSRYYAFTPENRQKLMLRFTPEATGENYQITSYLYDESLDEYLFHTLYIGDSLTRLITLEEIPDALVLKVEWVGDASPVGGYSLGLDAMATRNAGAELWTFETGDSIYAAPAVSGDSAYVGSRDDGVYALNLETGEKIWEYKTEGDIFSAPVVGNGRVYVGSNDRNLYCLDAGAGNLLWRYATDGAIQGPAAISGYRVYVGSDYNKLHCLDAFTGALLWTFEASGAIDSAPTISNNKVFFRDGSGQQLYCLDARTGDEIWRKAMAGGYNTSPAIRDNRIYVGNGAGKLLCIDIVDGNVIWEFAAEENIASSPIVSNDLVCFGSYDNRVYCLNAETGTEAWSYKTGDDVVAYPAVSGNKLFIGSEDDNLYCLDLFSGIRLWKYQTGGDIRSSVVIKDGKVLFGSTDKKMYCLDGGDPDLDHWWVVGHDLQHTGDPTRQKVLFRYGMIQATEVVPFEVYDLRLIQVYEDNDFSVDATFSVSDSTVAAISGNRLTALTGGPVVVDAVHEGEHFQKTLYLMTEADEFEGMNNDTPDTADALPPAEFWQGELMEDDADCYALTLDQGARIDIAFMSESLSADTRIEMFDAAGNALINVMAYDGYERVLSCGLPAGTYHVCLSHEGDSDPNSYYYLRYDVAETLTAFPRKPESIALDESKTGTVYSLSDELTYQFSLDAAMPVEIYFDPESPTADYVVELYDASEVLFQSAPTRYGQPVSLFSGLDAGNYAMRIRADQEVDATSAFSVTLRSGDQAYESEINDAIDQATRLVRDQRIRGALNRDDVDFYTFSLSAPAYLRLEFETLTFGTDYDLVLFKGDDQNPIVFNNCPKGTATSVEAGLTAGKYFFKVVQGEDWSAPSDYAVTLLDSASENLEIESNDTLRFANLIDKTAPKTGRIHSQDDTDYYGFYIAEEKPVQVDFSSQSSTGDYAVTFVGADDEPFYQKISQDGEAVSLVQKLVPGNYYIRVTADNDADPRHNYELGLSSDAPVQGLKSLVAVSISGSVKHLNVGETLNVKSIGSYSDAQSQELNDAIWTSLDETVAVVTHEDMASTAVITAKEAGTTTIVASYAGVSGKFDITVGNPGSGPTQRHGGLILVAGGGADSSDPLFASTQYLCDLIYQRFKGRFFTDEDIYYINPVPGGHDLDGDGYEDNIVDNDSPSVDGFGQAMTQWAVEHKTDGPLYVYLIDHGGLDTFKLFPAEILTAPDFKAFADDFQAKTNRQAIIMIEACKSGSFTDDLFDENQDRIVVTSTDEQNAYMQLQGRISFTQFFIDRLWAGDDLNEGWTAAKKTLADMGTPYSAMRPQLIHGGVSNVADVNLGGDFAIASLFPEIVDYSPDASISAGSSQNFFVELSELDGIESVWAVVVPPDYIPPEVSQDLEAPQTGLPTFDLSLADASGRYEGTHADFTFNGDYRVTFYARNQNGNVSVSPSIFITVSGGQEVPPSVGDVNQDEQVDLQDAVLVLQVLCGISPSDVVSIKGDVNKDGRIGAEDGIGILRIIAE